MKLWTVLVMIVLLLGGCSWNKDASKNESMNSVVAGSPAATKLLNALEAHESDINILDSDKSKIVFVLYYDNNDKISEYLSEMKSEGYEQTVYDATISSTVTLENKNQTISITMISDLEEFKKVNREKGQKYQDQLDNISDINMMVEIKEN